jgi:hypothetical protein
MYGVTVWASSDPNETRCVYANNLYRTRREVINDLVERYSIPSHESEWLMSLDDMALSTGEFVSIFQEPEETTRTKPMSHGLIYADDELGDLCMTMGTHADCATFADLWYALSIGELHELSVNSSLPSRSLSIVSLEN